MKTSNNQFELLVNFMERNGDITKPTKEARGRILALKRWEELTELLNADPTGESKSMEKWKKVWSDYKGNTKKKAAKISRAARGTGGGPALQLKLTDLEERVLNIIGPRAATGMEDIVEAGLPLPDQELVEPHQHDLHDSDQHTICLTEESPSIFQLPYSVILTEDTWNRPGPSNMPHVPPPAWLNESPSTPPPPCPSTPAPSRNVATPAPRQPRPPSAATPTLAPSTAPSTPHAAPARQGRTPRRRPRARGSPRRRAAARPSHVDQVAQQFHQADAEHRQFLKDKHSDNMRMRERELASEERWQEITTSIVAAINKFVDKY